MKKYFSLFSLALAVVVLASCVGGNPLASGRPFEILVVVDQDVRERPAGRALHDVFDTDVPGFPQSEPSFRRSEAHTSELQSRQYLVCRPLLENKRVQAQITQYHLLRSLPLPLCSG